MMIILFRYYKNKVGPPRLKKSTSNNKDWLDSWREKTGLNLGCEIYLNNVK